ncbi:MAG: flippase-like domain-containing protein [Planctomycetes bacterium]|nr:flippase-like domain-containing protein [Planctomycetota bacterium]
MSGFWRRRAGALVRYAVCVVAISWIVWNTDWGRLRDVWSEADRGLLFLSVLAFGPAPVLIAVRLKWLLDVHDVRLSTWQAIKVTFAGNFVINTLPVGTTGGDSVKAYYVARDTPNKHEAVTVVFFDRLIGMLGLVLMSGVMVLADWHNPAFRTWGRGIGVLVVLTLVGGLVYFSSWTRRVLRIDRLFARLPLGQHLERIDRAVLEFRQHPRRILACLVITNVLQVNCVAALFLGGWALGMVDAAHPMSSFSVYLAYTPICYLAGALPLGVMEGGFQQLFSSAAGLGTLEAALSLSLFSRFTQLVWSLPGGLIVLRSRPQAVEAPEKETRAPARTEVPARN